MEYKHKYDKYKNKYMKLKKQLNFHVLPLKQPYFNQIETGLKRYEMRINSGMMLNIKQGDSIKFVNGNKSCLVYVIAIEKFNSFREALESHMVTKILPGVKSIDEAVDIYNSIPGYQEKAKNNGVLLFKIIRPTGKMHAVPIQNPESCPTFDLIKSGKKVVEGRKNSPKYRNIVKGDRILFVNGDAKMMVVVTYVNLYKTIEEYLTNETLERALPCVDTIEKAVEIYNTWTSPEERQKLLEETGSSFIGIGVQVVSMKE